MIDPTNTNGSLFFLVNLVKHMKLPMRQLEQLKKDESPIDEDELRDLMTSLSDLLIDLLA